MKLGEKIKQLRGNLNLTQPELAQNAGIEQSYLSKLENDKGSPSFEVITKIAHALNMDAMVLIDSLDIHYVRENLAYIPEIAIKLEQRRNRLEAKFKRHYALAATLIVLGIAFVILGKSHSVFPDKIYEYKSMGLINENEINQHYGMYPLRELLENREKAEERIKQNIARLDERLILVNDYKGEGFVENYGNKRRYFEMVNERHQKSPWRDIFSIFGFILLTSGGFGLGYVFKFSR